MYSTTRRQLTTNDFEFIAKTLGSTTSERSSILHLTQDSESVTELLHHRELFERSMSTPPVFLNISPQLFFYVFVYQALEYRHIADDEVVDYIAGVCVEFRSNRNLWQFSTAEGGKAVYLVDLLNLLGDAKRDQQFLLRRYIGNVSLFLTGFFPDMIFQRCREIGAPPLQYYEQVGRSQFECAADDSRGYDEDSAPVFNTLAERFVEIRSAINVYNDAYLHLNSKKHSVDVIERQAATLDDENFRSTLDL
jgi:hypothetical protein